MAELRTWQRALREMRLRLRQNASWLNFIQRERRERFRNNLIQSSVDWKIRVSRNLKTELALKILLAFENTSTAFETLTPGLSLQLTCLA